MFDLGFLCETAIVINLTLPKVVALRLKAKSPASQRPTHKIFSYNLLKT